MSPGKGMFSLPKSLGRLGSRKYRAFIFMPVFHVIWTGNRHLAVDRLA
jgi:hypothetical protein